MYKGLKKKKNSKTSENFEKQFDVSFSFEHFVFRIRIARVVFLM